MSNNKSDKSPELKVKKSKKFFVTYYIIQQTENIFKDPPSWKPPSYNGDAFGGFLRLQNKKQMTDWEIERIHLVKRSFTKGTELKNRDFRHPNYYGTEFGDNKNNSLSNLGKGIISTFIKENEVN